MLYEMATGKRPFGGDTAAQVLVAHRPDRAQAPAPGRRRDTRRALGDREALPGQEAREALRLDRGPRQRARSRSDSCRVWPAVACETAWAAAALLALAGAALGLLLWPSTRSPTGYSRDTLLEVVPLTSYPGREAEPSFSPDGSQVAFSWNGASEANRDIYVKVIGSERPLRLTTDEALDGSPAWSPDGTRIAFLREQPGGGSEVRLVPPTGGGERRLTDVAAPAG